MLARSNRRLPDAVVKRQVALQTLVRYRTSIVTRLNEAWLQRIRSAHFALFVNAGQFVINRSTGRSWIKKRFLTIETCAMKTPSGFVTAKISAKKKEFVTSHWCHTSTNCLGGLVNRLNLICISRKCAS